MPETTRGELAVALEECGGRIGEGWGGSVVTELGCLVSNNLPTIPAALRSDPAGAAEMRERCARYHDRLAAKYRGELQDAMNPGRTARGPARSVAWAHADARNHEKYAADLRALPTQGGEHGE